MAVVLFLVAVLIGPLDEVPAFDSGDYWLRALLTAASLVGSFFIWDYVSALASFFAFSVLAPAADMLDRMPAWHNVLPLAGALAAATLLPMLVAALRGRLYREMELLPSYARVQAERLSLQAELSAAREAQLRLLPASVPAVAGLTLAASCTPAREVGGDFYDFIHLDDGSLTVIVAEGGNDGLASALAIALAKGFLLFEANACRDVHHTLARLERALGENLQRTKGRTAIALLLVNPMERTIGIARAGAFPRILTLTSAGVTRDASLLEDASDGIARGMLTLEAGDSVLVYTDGLARLAEQRHQGEVDSLLRRAAGFSSATSATAIHDLVLGTILPKDRRALADLSDDITAVVLSFSAAAAVDREEVA
jgi:sigma-B regulation protein RsbU (phosphoserine phosphatase)